jgi:hypothetical protein
MVQNQYQKASMPLDDTIEYQYGDRNKNYMSWYQKNNWYGYNTLDPRCNVIFTDTESVT